MKLEREEAIRLNLQEVGGKRTFELQHLADLMLNKKTRVFKTGLFWMEGGSPVGRVCDLQLGADIARAVANFFLHSFLGCKLRESPAVSTKRFWDAAERFLNEEVTDPQLQARYLLAMTAEMRSQSVNVNPASFAKHHLEVPDQDGFRLAMKQAGVGASFVKDNQRIEGKLDRVQYEFASGIRLSGPSEAMKDRVTIEEREDTTHVEFDDKLEGLHGKSR
jgi:hypothetical protein